MTKLALLFAKVQWSPKLFGKEAKTQMQNSVVYFSTEPISGKILF
jgi:hypothetical protein